MQTYFSLDIEIANLPFIMLGSMGAGKIFQNVEYAKDVIKKGEGLIVIDYIKNNEMAFVYNEYPITGVTVFERIESANLNKQEVTSLSDAVYTGDPLSSQMRKFFTSAAGVVLINDNMSLR